MAAVFEISINSNVYVSPEMLLDYADKYNCSFAITSATAISDWDWSQEKQIDETQALSIIEAHKIVLINGLVNDCIHAGAMLYMQGNTYQADLWMDTETISCLDASTLTYENKSNIEFVTDCMAAVFGKWQINWAAFGCEMLLFESEDMTEMIHESQNVFRWMIATRDAKDIDDNNVQVRREIMILDR